MVKDSNWDLDLRAGLTGESRVADLLSIDTVEIKTDRRWHETGNVYIETDCWYVGSQSWEPSGIRISKATHWAFVLEDAVLILPLDRLIKAVNDSGTIIICNIPPNPSRGFLLKVTTLIEHIRVACATEIHD